MLCQIKKAQQILKDLFIRCKKLNISLCFLSQSYFSVPKDVTLNCTHYILNYIIEENYKILLLIILLILMIKILSRFIEIVQNNLLIF